MELKLPTPAFAAPLILPVAAGAIAIGIFVLDTVTPLNIAVAVLYVVVVMIATSFLQRRGILIVASGCIALTLLSYLLSHGLSTSTALLRCFMSLSAIAITTLLALRYHSANMVLLEQARLLDLTHDTVFARDMNDIITYWNHGAEELYGWQREQALGKVTY